MNQTISCGEAGGLFSQKVCTSTLPHPLIQSDLHTAVKKRAALAKFSQGFVSFPTSFLLESTQSPLLQELLVLTLAKCYLPPASAWDWRSSSASRSWNLASFARFELHIAIDLHCIVKCITFGNQGKTNKQGWRSDGQREMPVLSEGVCLNGG